VNHPRRVSHRTLPLSLRCAQLLRAAPHLILKSEQLCTLNGSEKFCQLTLFALNQIQTLPLEVQRFIEKLTNLILIRLVTKQQLGSQAASDLALARDKLSSSRVELLVRRLELPHLRITQPKTTLNHFSRPLTKALFEHLPPRIRTLWSLPRGSR
jgi:hypothetical protein